MIDTEAMFLTVNPMIARLFFVFSILLNLLFLWTFSMLPDFSKGTRSAPHFEEAKFWGARCGQSFEDILNLMGAPLEVYLGEERQFTKHCGMNVSCYKDIFKKLERPSEIVAFVYQMALEENLPHFSTYVNFDSSGQLTNVYSGRDVD